MLSTRTSTRNDDNPSDEHEQSPEADFPSGRIFNELSISDIDRLIDSLSSTILVLPEKVPYNSDLVGFGVEMARCELQTLAYGEIQATLTFFLPDSADDPQPATLYLCVDTVDPYSPHGEDRIGISAMKGRLEDPFGRKTIDSDHEDDGSLAFVGLEKGRAYRLFLEKLADS